jgi:hypothetical protein
MQLEGLGQLKNPMTSSGNGTCNLPVCSMVPQATVLPSQSQSHVTTDDQSVNKSWIRAPCGSRDRTLFSV